MIGDENAGGFMSPVRNSDDGRRRQVRSALAPILGESHAWDTSRSAFSRMALRFSYHYVRLHWAYNAERRRWLDWLAKAAQQAKRTPQTTPLHRLHPHPGRAGRSYVNRAHFKYYRGYKDKDEVLLPTVHNVRVPQGPRHDTCWGRRT
ncbi:hypothetical protein DCS_01000 [Drechmeria coniospora]|uniref:Uncharacterized protein n=1 Tax=Drechmeria coniospora TaxID=98403 RepID=A0A151GRY4_DRECN|nr:hypothetical protein DCS_01000 [Drechmeria coniospora]KYK59866.1 hypothetical protein DCS_01000 [Drechmeria coniospora]